MVVGGRWLTDARLLASKIHYVYRTILQLPQIKAMFQSRKHLRFLMHLIGHMTLIQKTYGASGVKRRAMLVNGIEIRFELLELENSDRRIFSEFHPTLKYIQHSCYPNVMNIHTNGKMFMVTVRPIKQGEQLFMSFISISTESTLERQQRAPNCECTRCKGVCASAEQREKLSSDPAFVALVQNELGANDKSEKTLANCEILLQKYGHLDWCDEINAVLMKYSSCLYTRMSK